MFDKKKVLNDIFNLIYNHLQLKSDYFKTIKKIIKNGKKKQCKLESWFKGEILYRLYLSGYKVIPEYKNKKHDICISINGEKIYFELKDFFGGGQTKKNIERDIKKLKIKNTFLLYVFSKKPLSFKNIRTKKQLEKIFGKKIELKKCKDIGSLELTLWAKK